jgi:hypothetical protein
VDFRRRAWPFQGQKTIENHYTTWAVEECFLSEIYPTKIATKPCHPQPDSHLEMPRITVQFLHPSSVSAGESPQIPGNYMEKNGKSPFAIGKSNSFILFSSKCSSQPLVNIRSS